MIKNGKKIKLNIRGHTLNQSPGKIVVQKLFFELPCVPIGMLYPVELPISLSNIGETPLKYELNTALFEEENPNYISQKIVEFGNSKGVLSALKEGSLFVYFRPIEMKYYQFDIQLIVFNYFKEIQRITISLKGTPQIGLKDKLLNNFFKNDDILMKERIQLETDVDAVYISDDIINFKDMQFDIAENRIFFLYNHSETNTYAFNFLLFQMSRFYKKYLFD